MSFYIYTFAGTGLMLTGILETLSSADSHPPSSPIHPKIPPSASFGVSPSFNLIAASILSLSFISNSLVSLIDALNSTDFLGSALQLEVIAIAFLFLLYSISGILLNHTDFLPRPVPPFLPLILVFSFVEEFLLFYLQRKDRVGVENRYFDLLLLPILLCICSTLLDLENPNSRIPRFGRGVGLFSQGTWFVQMGVSFFTDSIAHGCSLHERSRGNYTIRCKGHPEYHRGRALATLQFNCHLVLIVLLVIAAYAFMCWKKGCHGRRGGEFNLYKPLDATTELQRMENGFTLDSDDENEDGTKEGPAVVSKSELII